MEKILAANLAALMAAHRKKALGTQTGVARATAGAVNQRTIGRILKGEHKAQIDTLEALAEAFGVEPYQLLVPGLNPRNPQVLRSLSPAEENLYRALDEARKGTQ